MGERRSNGGRVSEARSARSTKVSKWWWLHSSHGVSGPSRNHMRLGYQKK